MTQFSLITGKLKPKARGILLVTTDPPVKIQEMCKNANFVNKNQKMVI